MNITTKKLIFIIAALLAGIVLMASCSKEPEVKGGKKGKKSSAPTKEKNIPPDVKNTFVAVRNGQYANLNWHIDPAVSKIKQFNILRNTMGGGKQRRVVAELKSDATGFMDRLPDENAHWYWLRLT